MTSTHQIRFGILGCANIAIRSLMPAISRHPACRLAAVASRSRDKAGPLAAQYACRALGYEELIADPAIEAIYVPLPTGLHVEWVMKVLAAGKHVLCEKSLGCTEAEVSRMVAEARRRRRLLMETFQFRFHSQHAAAKEILASGVLGEIRCFRSAFGFPPFPDGKANIRYQKALGGGALLDTGAYTIKAATFMLGEGGRETGDGRREAVAVGSGSRQWGEGGRETGDGGREEVAVGSDSGQCESCISCDLCAREAGHPVKNEAGKFRVKAATLRYVPEHEVDVGGSICMEHDSGVAIQAAFGFDNFYQCNYEIWGSKGRLTAKRAFTAPPGFSPELVIETAAGAEVRPLPPDDHFANMLTRFTDLIHSGEFESEYEEVLLQAGLMGQVAAVGSSSRQ